MYQLVGRGSFRRAGIKTGSPGGTPPDELVHDPARRKGFLPTSLHHRQHKIIWNKISEKDHRPNSTEAKLEKLQDSFPGLMADVEEILHNRPASTSATIRDLIYESHLSNQTSNTDPNNGTADNQPTERSQCAGRDANKPQGSPVDSSRVTAGNSGEGRSNSKGKNKLDRQETSDEKTNRLDFNIKRANREEGCSRDKTSDESRKKCAGQEKNQKTSSRKANGTRSRSQTDTQGDGEDWDESETGSDSIQLVGGFLPASWFLYHLGRAGFYTTSSEGTPSDELVHNPARREGFLPAV
ncbi:hexokinase A [Puccinia graminis f. sp. tritici]|uniref:Hexokinase A n=1 Tax=Puccinia graminis f. sp. tritici TaxID=56615 RepID=A0A5B0QW51_PUCGR|nr:hexokinase A [Puccinia graminis f. sp. tritici]KAA1117551.1 hexokinase A [Puccinia graminis f. sp. tritici]